MTAYVNDEQKKEGAYGKAVKATLAATLAAGMVPAAAAFADEPAEAAEGNDVELLGLSHKDAWDAGTFTVVDNSGAAVAIAKNFAGTHYVAEKAFANDGAVHKLKPAKVVLANGAGELDLTDESKFETKWFKNAECNQAASDDDMKKAGTFYMQVKPTDANTDWAGCELKVEFKIASDKKSIENAELFQVNADDAKDLSDKDFVYTGAAFNGIKDGGDLNVSADGEALTADDYDVAFYARNDNSTPATVKDAGKYTAVITAKGNKYEGTKSIDFEVQKLDLSKATFEFENNGDTGFSKPTLVKANGSAAVNGSLEVSVVTPTPALENGKDAKGEYKYTISVKSDAQDKKNFVENASGTYTAVKAAANIAKKDVLYKGAEVVERYVINPGEAAFDLSKLTVKNGTNVLDAKYYTVEVLDKKGNVVDNSKIAETGEWTVRVTVKAKETGYALGGSHEFKVEVKTAQVASNDVVWKFDDVLATGTKHVTYDGTNALDKLGVTVIFGGKQLVEGTDYKVVVKKDGKEVKEAVEQGSYEVTLESDSYKLPAGEKFTVVVDPLTATELRIAPASLLHGDKDSKKLGYTGEAIVPAIQYMAGTDKDGEKTWKDLPAGSYSLSYKYAKANEDGTAHVGNYKQAKEMKELGFYKVSVADANAKDSITVTSNIDNDEYQVVEGKVYSDVAPSDWFYTHVYDAENAKYMFGMGNSDVFAPYLTTSRAMAAEVLFRMGGGSGTEGIVTPPFSDVADVDAWYFKSVAWASSMKIVAGYPGTTEFRPGADVTRAEFCVMMQRYAAVTGQGKALAAGEADEILAKYEDGAAVADWCKDAVAWAVKNEIFGGYKVLNPEGNITRAEMAKMTTVFQPKALDAHKAPSTKA